MRTMYDSTTPNQIPRNATLVAAYVDGRDTSGNYGEVVRLFPHAKIVKITVTGGALDAHVGDIENGDMTPYSGAVWAKRKVEHGWTPTLYCSADTWPSVAREVKALGIQGKVQYWIAHYGAPPVPPNGAVAIQYRDHGPNRENYDISAVHDYWPGVDMPTTPHSPLQTSSRQALDTLVHNLSTRTERVSDENKDREQLNIALQQISRVLAIQ